MIPAFFVLNLLAAAQDRTAIHAALATKVKEIYERANPPGISAAVVLADGTVITACAGYSDSKHEKPMEPDNVFCAGSTGKMLVAATVATLTDQGKLNLDDPLTKTFQGEAWFDKLPNAKGLTLRHLLHHTSGLSDHVYNEQFLAKVLAEPDKVWKAEELVAYLDDTKPLFPAGEGWSYADTNYVLAGLVAERATKKALFQAATDLVLKPAKIKEVWPALKRSHPKLSDGLNMPDSPLKVSGWMLASGKLPFNPQMEHGGGGTFTTPRGLAQWAKALYEAKAVSPKVRDLILDSVPSKLGRNQRYGLGLMTRPTPQGLTYGHGGWFPGYLTDVMYLVDQKIAVAIQINTDDMRHMRGSAEGFNREIINAIVTDQGSRAVR